MQSTVKDSQGEFLRVTSVSTVDRCKSEGLPNIASMIQTILRSQLKWKHRVVLFSRDERNDIQAYMMHDAPLDIVKTIKGLSCGELGNRTRRRQRREAGGLQRKGKKASVKSDVGGSENGEQRETAV